MDRLNWFFWMVRQDQSGWENHPKGSGFEPSSGSNRCFFKRSDRTNQDEKITLEFKPRSGSKLIFDQRPICDSRPEGQAWFFERSDRTNQKVMSSNLVQVQNRFFWPVVNFNQGLKTMINFRKVRQDQSGWESHPWSAGFEPCSGSTLWPEVNFCGFNPIYCIRIFRFIHFLVSVWLGLTLPFSNVCMYRILGHMALDYHNDIFAFLAFPAKLVVKRS